jgi:ABC-2 type transport system permease protein
MILALIKAQIISLLRDRMAMALSFALPCVMFSVFAAIFGGVGKSDPKPMKVIIADLDGTKTSSRMVDSLRSMSQIEVVMAADIVSAKKAADTAQTDTVKTDGEAVSSGVTSEDDRSKALTAVQTGKAVAAVVFPKGLESSFGDFGQQDRPSIELVYDPSNPMAEQMLVGVLQASAFTSSPDVLLTKGLDQFRTLGGGFSPLQEAAVQTMKAFLIRENADNTGDADNSTTATGAGSGLSMADGIVRIQSVNSRDAGVEEQPKKQTDGSKMISYYAAGISVMFIMFSMSGASSSLLEHQERGTLERLLSGKMTMFHLLAAHWMFYVALGVVQISLMFVFASVVFGLELWNVQTLLGAGLMAVVSSMASAAFIMMIATACRSRKQLDGLSSIIILIMSAIGGSMMPRFFMPAFLLKLSSVTFNAWSMDGFLKVFWYRTPETNVVVSILPEIAVILGMTAIFLTIARIGARRWTAS